MSERLRFMPALDGLRAFAVVGVLLYHHGLSWAGGGFLGVDLFFVLSGFLITSLLVREWRSEGTIKLRAFWGRRARRLLPALLLVLVASVVYAVFLARRDELAAIRDDLLSTLGYVANWRFVFSHQSYFDHFAAPSPLRHMWSLAIEEQFYLVWPFLVLLFLRSRRGSMRALATGTTILLVGSVTAMFLLYQPKGDPSRVYYGTDTRAQSLLVGALLAMLLTRVPGPTRRTSRALLQVGAGVSAAALVTMWVTVSDHSVALYRGGLLLEALMVACVIAAVVQPKAGPLAAALSFAPLRWIGRISYGLYLWHWPLFVVLDPIRTGLDGYALLGVRVVASLIAATLSFYLVEQPIRHGTISGRTLRRIALPIPVVVIAAMLLLTTSAATPLPTNTADNLQPPKVQANGVDAVSQTRVMLVGDSLIDGLAPSVERLAATNEFVNWNAAIPGCGISGDVGEYWTGIWQLESESCRPGWRERWPPQIAQYHPDVVVALFGGHDTVDHRIDGTVIRFDSPAGTDLAQRDILETTRILSADGAKVVWLTLPYSKQGWAQQVDRDRSAYNDDWVDRWNQILHDSVATMPETATVLEFNALVDPLGTWTEVVNGMHLRGPDLIHFSPEGADYIASWLVPHVLAVVDDDTASGS